MVSLNPLVKGDAMPTKSVLSSSDPLVKRSYSMRRECSSTASTVFHQTIVPSSTAAFSMSAAAIAAIDIVRPLFGVIDWVALAAADASLFGVPDVIVNCPSKRYVQTITMPKSHDDEISDLCVRMRVPFNQVKKRAPYRNLVLALVLRAAVAVLGGFIGDFIMVAQSEPVPYDPDMLETLYPNGTNLPDGLEIIE